MKRYLKQVSPGLSVEIIDYFSGTFRFRISMPVKLTKIAGPESGFEPENPQVYESVSMVLEKILPGRNVAPGQWEVRDEEELDRCMDALARAFR